MSDDRNDVALAKAVVSIMRVAGLDWDNFMRALVARADKITDELVGADSAHLQQMQGRAQEARALLYELARAPTLAEQVYNKERQHHGRNA